MEEAMPRSLDQCLGMDIEIGGGECCGATAMAIIKDAARATDVDGTRNK